MAVHVTWTCKYSEQVGLGKECVQKNGLFTGSEQINGVADSVWE